MYNAGNSAADWLLVAQPQHLLRFVHWMVVRLRILRFVANQCSALCSAANKKLFTQPEAIDRAVLRGKAMDDALKNVSFNKRSGKWLATDVSSNFDTELEAAVAYTQKTCEAWKPFTWPPVHLPPNRCASHEIDSEYFRSFG